MEGEDKKPSEIALVTVTAKASTPGKVPSAVKAIEESLNSRPLQSNTYPGNDHRADGTLEQASTSTTASGSARGSASGSVTSATVRAVPSSPAQLATQAISSSLIASDPPSIEYTSSSKPEERKKSEECEPFLTFQENYGEITGEKTALATHLGTYNPIARKPLPIFKASKQAGRPIISIDGPYCRFRNWKPQLKDDEGRNVPACFPCRVELHDTKQLQECYDGPPCWACTQKGLTADQCRGSDRLPSPEDKRGRRFELEGYTDEHGHYYIDDDEDAHLFVIGSSTRGNAMAGWN